MSQSDQGQIQPPGTEAEMTPQADHGEASYQGSNRLAGLAAVITGGDSGIGRAVAIAYAREGADVLISYLNEREDADARETARHVEAAGRRCVLVPGDIAEAAHCRAIIDRAVREFGRVDVLVNNAAFQRTYRSLDEVPDEEWDYTFRTNIAAMFHLAKAAVPHMRPGASSPCRSVNAAEPRNDDAHVRMRSVPTRRPVLRAGAPRLRPLHASRAAGS